MDSFTVDVDGELGCQSEDTQIGCMYEREYIFYYQFTKSND